MRRPLDRGEHRGIDEQGEQRRGDRRQEKQEFPQDGLAISAGPYTRETFASAGMGGIASSQAAYSDFSF